MVKLVWAQAHHKTGSCTIDNLGESHKKIRFLCYQATVSAFLHETDGQIIASDASVGEVLRIPARNTHLRTQSHHRDVKFGESVRVFLATATHRRALGKK